MLTGARPSQQLSAARRRGATVTPRGRYELELDSASQESTSGGAGGLELSLPRGLLQSKFQLFPPGKYSQVFASENNRSLAA